MMARVRGVAWLSLLGWIACGEGGGSEPVAPIVSVRSQPPVAARPQRHDTPAATITFDPDGTM